MRDVGPYKIGCLLGLGVWNYMSSWENAMNAYIVVCHKNTPWLMQMLC